MIPTGFLQDLAEQFLPETATISRATETVTSGGVTQTWATVATVAARISQPQTPAERTIAEGIRSTTAIRITLPVGTSVTPKDRIVIGSRTFEVVGVPAVSYPATLNAICAEVL